ncbi:hypothetical protein [Vibrio hepatarius]|uniref:hypothetical protein n=1 Tax=Vibrio hepatarius TaxID=171383 RepID=UPI003736525A
MKRKSLSINKDYPWVIGISVILNILFVAYLIVQANSIHRLETVVLDEAPISFEMTQKLADIERTIGYVGLFITSKITLFAGMKPTTFRPITAMKKP